MKKILKISLLTIILSVLVAIGMQVNANNTNLSNEELM